MKKTDLFIWAIVCFLIGLICSLCGMQFPEARLILNVISWALLGLGWIFNIIAFSKND